MSKYQHLNWIYCDFNVSTGKGTGKVFNKEIPVTVTSYVNVTKLTLICLFIVIQNKVMKYITSIGQNTGILNASTKVQTNAISVLLVTESQNLNSGNRLMKGRNSSVALVGRAGPFSSSPVNNFVLFRCCYMEWT